MKLADLSQVIDEVEKILFHSPVRDGVLRKKLARVAFRLCPDDNLRHLLGNAVGYHIPHPDWAKNEISKARGHLETLRENGHT